MIVKKIRFFIVIGFIVFARYIFSTDISIIIPTYQDDERFPAFFKDLTRDPLFATYDILVESISSCQHKEDRITAVVQKYPNVRIIKLYGDPGLGFLLNTAIYASYGEYLIVTTPLFRYKQYAFDLMKDQFSKKHNIEMVFAGYYKITTDIDNFYDIYSQDEKLISVVKETPCWDLNCPIMWKKSLHKKYGYFNESYYAAADIEFWVRAKKNGLKPFQHNRVCAAKLSGLEKIRLSSDYRREYKDIVALYSENKTT